MKRQLPEGSSARSRRGLVIFALLAGTLVALGAGLVAALVPSSVGTVKQDAQNRMALARASYLDHDLLGAEKLLRELLMEGGNDRPARLLLGRVLLDRGRLVGAREAFDGVLKEAPKDVDGLRGRGQVLRAMGQPDAAGRCLQSAVDLRKDDPGLWKELGLLQRDAGDSMGAFASLQKSLTLDPEQADISALLSDLLRAPLNPGIPDPVGRGSFPDPVAPPRAEDLLRNANRPRLPGVDPLMPSNGQPGPR